MFKGPMNVQYQKFVDMLNMIVAFIDHPERLTPEVIEMAKRHDAYGAQPAHYLAVGKVLLWTLEKGMGKQWNEEVEAAWAACYDALMQVIYENA